MLPMRFARSAGSLRSVAWLLWLAGALAIIFVVCTTSFAVALALQLGRARIEERKFLRTVPEYAEYRRTTGFLWPRFRRMR